MSNRKGRLPGIDVEPAVVKQARLDAGLSMAQLAGGDFTRQTVFLIEAGKARPSQRTLDIIAERTGQPMAHFLKGAHANGTPKMLFPNDPVRQEFYEELCEEVDAWQDEFNDTTNQLERLQAMLDAAYALKEAMEQMGSRS